MAKQLPKEETVTIEELVVSHMYEMMALVTLLDKKGIIRSIFEERQYINKVKPFNITVDEAERAWKWVRAKMGFEMDEEFVIHALRHTCASRLVNAGVDLYVVKEWLGHSTIQVTERYAHLNPVKLVHAATMLE